MKVVVGDEMTTLQSNSIRTDLWLYKGVGGGATCTTAFLRCQSIWMCIRVMRTRWDPAKGQSRG
jgi:hypothetical protein